MASAVKNKVCLISIDGWGIKNDDYGNAIAKAKTPTMKLLHDKFPYATLDASGLAVGLPKGVMGNSEVGHLTMGCGRVDFQDLVRITQSIEDGSFFHNAVLLDAFKRATDGNGRVHLLGLVSDGGVHSHIEHIFAFLDAAKQHQVPQVFVHFFGDGRDTAPTSGVKYVEQLQKAMVEKKVGKIATIIGRYYAMDRDKRWERMKIAYDALVGGVGEQLPAGMKPEDLIRKRYEANETDEFLKPIIVNKDGLIRDGDVLIFFDFRSDRMRQIAETFAIRLNFATDFPLKKVHVYQMTQYNASFKLPIIFPPQCMDNVLAEWLSKHSVAQFHTAETEKYAHVTFFFNGGREAAFPREDRLLVPSPKVATYDLLPQMSQEAVGDKVVEALSSQQYPFVMCNLAAPDMVGHTGVIDKTIIAVETADHVIGRILEACDKYGYILVVTADHGNAEEMLEPDGKVKTSHTTNVIPLCIHPPPSASLHLEMDRPHGGLRDVAPTILHLLGLPVPAEMTGKSMVK